MTHGSRISIASVLCLALTSAAATGAADGLTSRWRTDDMKVDGSPMDWPVITPITREMSVAVANDADVLQLVITTSNQAARLRLTIAGLMIYIDPANKKSEAFGIRIPPLGGRPVPGDPPPDPAITYVEVFGAGKDDRHLVQLPATNGIEAAAANHEGTLVIELAVPLRAGDKRPFAPGIAADRQIVGLGFVTPNPPAQMTSAGPGGSYGGAGRGAAGGGSGRVGGMPPGGGAGPGGGNPQGKAFKIWTTVELAQRAR